MPKVTCIIDGQYGSCGKGAICGHLANEFDVAVRVGAPNAGHTLKIDRRIWKFQQIPVAALINKDMRVCIGAAGLINEEVLRREMNEIENTHRLMIDRNAGILEPRHKEQEEAEKMFEGIGSTCEGVGAARRDKIKRDKKFRTAGKTEWLREYITNVAIYLNTCSDDTKVMIEGTQGYGLSMNHGQYPYTTSCDVLASSLLSDVGLAPQTLEHTIMVIRTYPIRVFGNSGPMCGKELSWDDITKRSGAPKPIVERTTVTNRVRRVCEFDIDMVREACLLNRPTQLAVTFMDYIDHKDYGKTEYNALSEKSRAFTTMIYDKLGIPVTLIKTGPDNKHIIDLRGKYTLTKNLAFDEGNNI